MGGRQLGAAEGKSTTGRQLTAAGRHRRGPWAPRGLWLLAVSVGLVAAAAGWRGLQPGRPAPGPEQVQVTLYQSPSCGCCGRYVDYLRAVGYSVRVVATQDLEAVKRRFRVPRALWSCHTAQVGRYFVEGHVPAGALEHLLRREPDVLGIALPGMPPGSPGMDGPRAGPLVVLAVRAAGGWQEFGTF